MNVIDYHPWPETGSGSITTTTNAAIWHKPEGRGRHFRRKARGLSRRLRLWFVQQTRWEQAHGSHPGSPSADSYGPPWTSDSALADFSFACTCHKRPRYDRKRSHA